MRKMPNDVEKLDHISGSIDADGKGNAKVGKDLTIDGNLKFKSLVSGDNPEGVFDPSSGGTGGGGGTGGSEYIHSLEVKYGGTDFFFNRYNSIAEPLTLTTLKTALSNKKIACSGVAYNNERRNHVMIIYVKNGSIYAGEYAFIDNVTSKYSEFIVDSTYKITDIVSPA